MSNEQLALYLDRFVRRMHGVLHAKALEFDTDKVGPIGAMALLTLSDHGALPIQTVAEKLARDKSQITRVVHLLEEKGMISRARSEQDARVTFVALTPKGEEMVDKHRNAVAETIDEVVGPLSLHERDLMIDVLKRA